MKERMVYKGINEDKNHEPVEPQSPVELLVWRDAWISAARNIEPCRPHEHVFHCNYLAGLAVAEFRKRKEAMTP